MICAASGRLYGAAYRVVRGMVHVLASLVVGCEASQY